MVIDRRTRTQKTNCSGREDRPQGGLSCWNPVPAVPSPCHPREVE